MIAERKRQQWRRRIIEQVRSGKSVRRFCEEQGLGEQSFYWWRKRLQKQEPARVALVDGEPARPEAALELVLTGG